MTQHSRNTLRLKWVAMTARDPLQPDLRQWGNSEQVTIHIHKQFRAGHWKSRHVSFTISGINLILQATTALS